MRREPFAARRGFYPANPRALESEIDRCLPKGGTAREAIAVVAPHAGYTYSGPVAGKLYAAIEVPDRVVVLCPKHTPYGSPLGAMTGGTWAMPGFDVPIDGDLARALVERCGLDDDPEPHLAEHSLEVQLPFLHRRNPAFRLVPIAVGRHRYDDLRALGEGIADVVSKAGGPVLLVASSDMSHEAGLEIVRRHDPMAIARMEALDAKGLHDVVTRNGITMCGFAPAVAVMTAAKILGATRGELLGYETSLDHGGTEDWVVGYAAIVFPRDASTSSS